MAFLKKNGSKQKKDGSVFSSKNKISSRYRKQRAKKAAIVNSVRGNKPKNSKRYKNTVFLKALGTHCKKLRTQRGYSIDRMAKEGEKLSPSVIHRLETGEGAVTISALLRYAEILDVPLKHLFDFTFDDAKD